MMPSATIPDLANLSRIAGSLVKKIDFYPDGKLSHVEFVEPGPIPQQNPLPMRKQFLRWQIGQRYGQWPRRVRPQMVEVSVTPPGKIP
jgi:hypothetical protein